MIRYLTRVHFDENILEKSLCEELILAEKTRPLIITDKGVTHAGLVDRVYNALPKDCSFITFDETPANPTEASARTAAQLYTNENCDCLIALGGGSPIDLAKAVALTVTHRGKLVDYAAIYGGVAKIANCLPPLFAIPTTAGTGSEVGRGALIIVNDGRKLGFLSPYFVPTAAICDPTLTYDLPPSITAATGMDAITHCIETFLAPAYNPPADGIAIEGLRLSWPSIEDATYKSSTQSRRNMMAAAMMGAMAFQKGLGAVHAISHALGGLKGKSLHHGTLNAVLLPHVIRFNAPACENRYPRLLEAMGYDYNGVEDFVSRIIERNSGLGLPSSLSEMGVKLNDVDTSAMNAEKDHTNATNPRLVTASDYIELIRNAL